MNTNSHQQIMRRRNNLLTIALIPLAPQEANLFPNTNLKYYLLHSTFPLLLTSILANQCSLHINSRILSTNLLLSKTLMLNISNHHLVSQFTSSSPTDQHLVVLP